VELGAAHPPGVSSLQPSRFNRRGTGKSSVEPAEEIDNREECEPSEKDSAKATWQMKDQRRGTGNNVM
jgi:hypothetical protein